MLEDAWKTLSKMTEKEFHKAWSKAERLAFSGSEVDQPRMLMLSLFYFHTAPLKVRQFFSGDKSDSANKIAMFLHAAIDDTKEWLRLSPIANEQIKQLDRITSVKHGDTWIDDTLSALTPEMELMYIADTTDEPAVRKIRVKILAALDVQRSLADMRTVTQPDSANYIISYFYMLRSLVQFSSYAAAIDGTHSQVGRKAPKPSDYTGYLCFIKRYFPNFPSSGEDPQYLWNQIKSIFHSDGLTINCNYYKMSLTRHHLPKAVNQEGFRQISPSGKKSTLGFKAFSNLLRSLKDGSLKLT